MSHTQGKLHASSDPGIWNASTDEDGSYCYQSLADESGTVIALVVAHSKRLWVNPDTQPNARRLVAAWNACDGVSTEDLENLAKVDEGFKRQIKFAYDYRAERDQLKPQRDALLEALKELTECPFDIDPATVSSLGLEETMNGNPYQVVATMSVSLARIRKARAAIASAEKGGA